MFHPSHISAVSTNDSSFATRRILAPYYNVLRTLDLAPGKRADGNNVRLGARVAGRLKQSRCQTGASIVTPLTLVHAITHLAT